MTSRQAKGSTVVTAVALHVELSLLAQEFPHIARHKVNTQFKTTFYNVYFKEQVEEWLLSVQLPAHEAYRLIEPFVEVGLTVKLIPKNYLGFCQATVSNQVTDGSKMTHSLSGEAGNIPDALVAVYVKHMLIVAPEGYWQSQNMDDRSNNRFR